MRGLARLALVAILYAASASADPVVFRNALDDSPLKFQYKTEQTLTPAVERFREKGSNPYAGEAEAISAGEAHYKKLCQACHLKDGTGRIGPDLTDDAWLRKRADTDVGRFEIIYGGGAGAMQPFGRRMTQDEILEVMAYIDTFRGG